MNESTHQQEQTAPQDQPDRAKRTWFGGGSFVGDMLGRRWPTIRSDRGGSVRNLWPSGRHMPSEARDSQQDLAREGDGVAEPTASGGQ